MADTQGQSEEETLTHRLILPRDANHYGTLYAGALLSLALEAGYATAFRAAGPHANLVLKRVMDLRCHEPVQVGRVVEIRGREVQRARAHIIVGLWGGTVTGAASQWMDALMQFVQVDGNGRPEPLSVAPADEPLVLAHPWSVLQERARRLSQIRH